MSDQQVTATLENWTPQVYENRDEYVIWGHIEGDSRERWPDGTYIHTSGIHTKNHNPDSLKEGDVIHTRNSTYKLGRRKSDCGYDCGIHG